MDHFWFYRACLCNREGIFDKNLERLGRSENSFRAGKEVEPQLRWQACSTWEQPDVASGVTIPTEKAGVLSTDTFHAGSIVAFDGSDSRVPMISLWSNKRCCISISVSFYWLLPPGTYG